MRKTIGLLLAALLIVSAVPIAFAEDVASQEKDDSLVNDIGLNDAGVTPDKPILWGLERAQERIKLALILDKAKKANMRLKIANERLAEVNAMIKANRLDAAEKAQKVHDKEVEAVEEDVSKIDDSKTETELERVVELQAMFKGHQIALENVRSKLERANLTEEQRAKFEEIVARFEANVERVDSKLETKRDRIKTKLLAKGSTEDDIAELEENAETEALAKIEARKEQIRERLREGKIQKDKATEEDSDEADIDDDSELEDSEETEQEQNQEENQGETQNQEQNQNGMQ